MAERVGFVPYNVLKIDYLLNIWGLLKTKTTYEIGGVSRFFPCSKMV